jgi:hypothetical protein
MPAASCGCAADIGCFQPPMKSIEATNVAPQPGGKHAPAPPVPMPHPGSQSYSLPLALFFLALIVEGAGGQIVKHFGGSIYPIAYLGAWLAAIGLALVWIGGRREPALRASRLLLGASVEQWSSVAVFVFFLTLYGVTRQGPTPFNEPSVQAAAFLHGHSWVDAPGHMEQVGPICNINLPSAKRLPECDFTRYGNRTFLVHPPLAAIVMMPFVAAHGGDAAGAEQYQPTVSALLGALEVALAWRLLLVLGMSTFACLWLTAFFGLGTTLWYEATLGASWDFVLVVSVLPTLLALNELFGKGRPWLVGLFAALAALGRNDLVMAWPFYALLLLVRGRRIRELWWMGPGFAMAAIVYGTFNYTRYGTFFDQSLWLWYRCCDGAGASDPANHGVPGPFSIHFLPRNVYTVLFMNWGFGNRFPWLFPMGSGQALMFTSPAFILALRSSLKKAVPVLIWLAALFTMAGALSVYANGFVQFGPRYWVQVYPFLLVLVALGMEADKPVDQLTKVLILASIFLVCLGIWEIRIHSFA